MADRSVANDEPRWHASLAVIAALILYITLPSKVTFGPLWLFPLLVLSLLVPLSIFAPMRRHETTAQRLLSIILIAIVNLFNIASLALLVSSLLNRPAHVPPATGQHLLVGGIQIWLTNILVFAMWYWEADAGGPEQRAHAESAATFEQPDFFFPQMSTELRVYRADLETALWRLSLLGVLHCDGAKRSRYASAHATREDAHAG